MELFDFYSPYFLSQVEGIKMKTPSSKARAYYFIPFLPAGVEPAA
jgi:hypothetical protein